MPGRVISEDTAVARCDAYGRVGSLVVRHAGTGQSTSRSPPATKPGVPCVAYSMRNHRMHARQTQMSFSVVVASPELSLRLLAYGVG